MAALKTTPNDKDVESFLEEVEDEKKREDSFAILKLLKEETGMEPKMWGPGIVGFGSYHYKYESGREGDWFLTGFSPRKKNLTVYIMPGFDRYEELISKLGKFTTGTSCLYFKKTGDIDLDVLRELVSQSVAYMQDKYPDTE